MTAAAHLSPPTASWRIERRGKTIEARFDGYLDADAGTESAAELERATKELREFRLIFDVGAMEGYDNEARRAWSRVMRLRRQHITSIETIGASPIIRLGASLLGMLAGVVVEHRQNT